MICGKCGKDNDAANDYCSFCNSLLKASESGSRIIDKERYENDLGFADPASEYIKPQIKEEQEDTDLVNAEEEQATAEKAERLAKQRRKKQRRLTFGSAAVTLTAVLIFAVLSFLKRDTPYYFQAENTVNFYQDSSNGALYVLNSQGDILQKSSEFSYALQTPDHSAIVLINNVIPQYINSQESKTLDFASRYLNISDNGKFIIYTTSGAIDTKSLYRYDVENGKKELIDQTANKEYVTLNILPNGKTMTYAAYSTDNPADVEAFLYKEGSKPVSIGKNRVILAVSYDNEYMYYGDVEDSMLAALYVQHGGVTRKLLDDFTEEHIFFNQDYSEIMFTDNGSTFVSAKGSEKVKVADIPVFQILVPDKCIAEACRVFYGFRYGIDSFRNKAAVFQSNTVGYINDNYQMEQISTNDESFNGFSAVSEDGNYLLYQTTGNKLIKINLKENLSKEIQVNKVDSAAASGDFSEIYYLYNNILYGIKGKAEPVTLAVDVNAIYLNASGDTLIFTQSVSGGSSALYYSSDGKTVHLVPGTENFSGLSAGYGSLVYTKYEKGKINTYYNTRGAKFILLQNEEDITD